MQHGRPAEAELSQLKQRLEDEALSHEQRASLLRDGLQRALSVAAVQTDSGALTRVKTHVFLSGVLSHCVQALSLDPRRLQGSWSAATTLAQLTSSCCVGVEPGEQSEAFHRLLLPSVMDCLLSLASQLMKQAECLSLFRKVMDSVGWLLGGHAHLSTQVLSSVHYEQIQMWDDVPVSVLCVQLWIQACTDSRDFLPGLREESVMLLLNDAVSQLAVSSEPAVGGACVRLLLLIGSQTKSRPLLLKFRGLDSLLAKDWRGRGIDQEVDQLIALIQPQGRSQCGEHVRAACVIQAAWRSYRCRSRVKNLNTAVSSLQRRYRSWRKRQQQQLEVQQWEEELKYQVCVSRQQARREFHYKQRQLLQLLPPDQVPLYLTECERRAAVVIQSFWRGYRQRQHYYTLRHTLRHTHTQQQAARTLQRAVRLFLKRRRCAKAPPVAPFWIGQKSLTDSRRVELKRQVEEYITLHHLSNVSPQQCVALHEEMQRLLLSELQRGDQQRREEERREALLAHTHTQLELLRDTPPLSVVTTTDAESLLSPSASIATCARDAHNAMLRAGRLPWWRMLSGTDGEDICSSAHLVNLEADFGGLFLGGGVFDPLKR
ncbi:IQ calmodulin-binding motif-containing protein 1 [Genypterus blacodes]|uniref:IQ calmodulin-binding motif-containing protein 1 n=1 Tax=Genypterus blacodes TaxID=154954 RepID=UPI003F757BDB